MWPRPQGQPPMCTAHARPAVVLEALLPLLYPVAVGQAVCLAAGVEEPAAAVAEALLASPQLASALGGAVAAQLLPWLQRCRILSALLAGTAAPAPPSCSSGAAAAMGNLLAQLRLPPPWEALCSPPAACLPPSTAQRQRAQSGAGTQLSVRVGGRQWRVSVPPPAAPAQLLDLPPAYQVCVLLRWAAAWSMWGRCAWPVGWQTHQLGSAALHA